MNLGELEKAVLQYLWENPDLDVKSVFSHFEKLRGGTLNTVQSTMDRLYRKGLLSREKSGHAFLYRPAKSKSELLALLINGVTKDFIANKDNSVATAFASVSSEISDKELDELATLIEKRRQQRGQVK